MNLASISSLVYWTYYFPVQIDYHAWMNEVTYESNRTRRVHTTIKENARQWAQRRGTGKSGTARETPCVSHLTHIAVSKCSIPVLRNWDSVNIFPEKTSPSLKSKMPTFANTQIFRVFSFWVTKWEGNFKANFSEISFVFAPYLFEGSWQNTFRLNHYRALSISKLQSK